MASDAAQDGIRLTRHPRAQRQIGMAKSYTGLAAFGVVVWLSTRAGVPTADAVLRGLLGGAAGYVVAWGIAVTVWRHVALAELEHLRASILTQLEQQAADAAARTGAVVTHGDAGPASPTEPARQG
jgi:uncharacterized membrane protein YccC